VLWPCTGDSREWFVSQMGTDNPECGTTLHTACRRLDIAAHSRRCFTHRPGILALPAALLPRCQCWRAGIRAPVSDNNVIKRLRQTDDQLWGGCSRRHCEVCFEVAQRYDDWRWPGGRRLSCNRLQLTPDWINHLHNAHLPLTAHAHEAHQLDVFRAFAVQSDDVAE